MELILVLLFWGGSYLYSKSFDPERDTQKQPSRSSTNTKSKAEFITFSNAIYEDGLELKGNTIIIRDFGTENYLVYV